MAIFAQAVQGCDVGRGWALDGVECCIDGLARRCPYR